MKRLGVTERTTGPAAPSTGVRCFAIVLAAAGLGIVAGCGGGERLSREEFADRLQSIDQRGGERWARIAQRAKHVRPGQPLPAALEQPIRELVAFQRRAVGELEGLNPPGGAEEEVEQLIEALRERTGTFERASEAGRLTQRDFDEITQSGEEIDTAFERFREKGFLPRVEDHEE